MSVGLCDTDLGAPRGGGSATGRVEIYNRPPTRFEMLLTGKGLRPIGDGELEAVWVLPAVTTSSGGYQLQRSARPQLLGVIQPSVGAMGRLSVESLLPQAVAGTYQILITVQPQAELLGPGTVVLEGFISF